MSRDDLLAGGWLTVGIIVLIWLVAVLIRGTR
jgi:hypothetical protein